MHCHSHIYGLHLLTELMKAWLGVPSLMHTAVHVWISVGSGPGLLVWTWFAPPCVTLTAPRVNKASRSRIKGLLRSNLVQVYI